MAVPLTGLKAVYHESCCNIHLGHGLSTFTAVPRPTQPSTFRGTVKWVSVYGLSNKGVDGSSQFSANSQPRSIGLIIVLAATRRLVCIHQMNRVNSHNNFCHDNSAITLSWLLLLINRMKQPPNLVLSNAIHLLINTWWTTEPATPTQLSNTGR